MSRAVAAVAESWPLRETFTIARGSKHAAQVVVVTISEASATGRGECVPYARYGETVASVIDQVHQLEDRLAAGMTRAELLEALPPGAARNACDCALWDLEARRAGQPVWRLAGLAAPRPVVTAYTISLAEPAAMANAAAQHAHRPLLKVKVGAAQVMERIRAVRTAAPAAQLIVDANEAWTPQQLAQLLPKLATAGVALLEQPLPAGQDECLAQLTRVVPVAADESCHVAADVSGLAGRYDLVNVKLDKSGGLTAALELVQAAEAAGLGLMIGCMVSTSLAVAPAMLLCEGAAFVDLDGPLLLAADRAGGLKLHDHRLQPPTTRLWG
jgi:L-alanine-DL-glutamate epimerase-like enolase superfamily enzyme